MVIKTNELDLNDKNILIRVDFNVPIRDGKVEDDTRIKASIPTIQHVLEVGGRVRLMSHLGRPTEGEYDEAYSLKPVAEKLAELLGCDVPLIRDWQNGIESEDNILMLENVRFAKGEKANDDELARHMANLCHIYINDAFATAHRAQASTHGVAKYAPVACAGPLMMAELDALGKALEEPAKPMVAVVGGSKVSTKLTILDSLSEKVDQLIVGGGIANTFLKAAGHKVGQSLCEDDLLDEARRLMAKAEEQGRSIPIPVDVVCAKAFAEDAEAHVRTLDEVEDDDLILDVGPETAKQYAEILAEAKTTIWNGPLGVFEFDQFGEGTRALSEAIANSEGFSIAGGGDTLSAISKYQISDKVSYISTGGGAFLEFLEGKELPAVAILEESARAWEAMEKAREY